MNKKSLELIIGLGSPRNSYQRKYNEINIHPYNSESSEYQRSEYQKYKMQLEEEEQQTLQYQHQTQHQ